MSKNRILENLDAAKRSHIKWLNRAKSMVYGSSSIRDPHPLKSTACQFGLWFNSEGTALYQKHNLEGFTKVYAIHNKLHDKYLNIYEIYFGSAEGVIYNQKASLTKMAISKTEEDKAINHMNQLKELSYSLLQEIANLQKTIENSSTE